MVTVRAVPAKLPDGAPRGLRVMRLTQWSLLDSGSRALTPGITGNLFGDSHLAPGSSVQVYHLTKFALHQGWVASPTRLYLLGNKKEQ